MRQDNGVTSQMLRPILGAGLLAGTLDLTAAFIQYGLRGVSPVRIAQSIASGLLGRAAYQGGSTTAALGTVLHFAIAISAAAAYYVASREFPLLNRRPLLMGPLFGIVVYAFMNYVVLPLSRFPPGRFDLTSLVTGLLIHVFCVGLPIAIVVAGYSRRPI
jgi:hypothetical protein